MTDVHTAEPESPRWNVVAELLEKRVEAPTPEQIRVAEAIGIELPSGIPAPVAAVVLRQNLSDVLFDRLGGTAEIPDALTELEDELGITTRARLITGAREEVSAWFAARYMVMAARGLREARPGLGDVVVSHGWRNEMRVVSSIGDDGRVYMKGRPSRKAWPNHLEVIERVGESGHAAAIRAVDAALRNTGTYTSNFAELQRLRRFALPTHVPSPEAVRAFEELLESGATDEEPFQTLLTRHPALLSSTVVGGWQTYVLPKQRLGGELIPDFLVLGINSVGPRWVLVEIEAPRHDILLQDGSLSGPTRHGVKQVQDWREWLTTNVAYAQAEHHLYGLTNQAAGLVIIGRDDPKAKRDASRAQSAEGPRIAIHSWDWLLRNARNLTERADYVSEFAMGNASVEMDGGSVGASSTSEVDPLEYLDEVEDHELIDPF